MATRSNAIYGTPTAMSPEQALGRFDYASEFAPDDGLLTGPPQGRALRVARGGSYHKVAFQARASDREVFEATVINSEFGLRPARAIQP